MDSLNFSLVYDHYFLESLKASFAVMSEDDRFSPAKSRLIERVEEAHSNLIEAMARKFRDYLYVACCGEARHANSMADEAIPEIGGGIGRTTACENALDFEPTQRNWGTLIELFEDTHWHCGGYGGQKWAEIAKFGASYGTKGISDGFFVDHAIDLEHNGGNVFDKCQAMNVVKLGYDFSELRDFRDFLDWKFEANVLSHALRNSREFKAYGSRLSSRTIGYLRKYALIFHGVDLDAPPDSGTSFPSAGFEHVTWGNCTFSYLERVRDYANCEKCGCSLHDADACNYRNSDGPYCYGCFRKLFTYCGHCDEYHSSSQTVQVGSNQEEWCDDCVDNHAVECDGCGYLIDESDIYGVDGGQYCNDCISDCDHCGVMMVTDDSVSYQWGSVCQACNDDPDFDPASLYDSLKDPAQPALPGVVLVY